MRPANFYKRPGKFFLLQVFLLFSFHAVFAQTGNRIDTIHVHDERPVNKKIFWWVTAGHIAGYGGSLAGLAGVWYKDFDRTSLHTFNDMDEWGGMDKLGHVNTAWQLSNFSYSLYRYSGMHNKKAALIGSSFAMLYQTTLEFFDGFSAKWGFSFGDMGANFVGASLAYLRNIQVLRNVQFKFTWSKTSYPPYRPDVLGQTTLQQVLKDYNGQTYWLSMNLPRKWFKENRNWLCFSLGYSIDGYTGGKANYFDASVVNPPDLKRQSEFYLSLDLDVSKFNIRKKWVKQVLKVFNVVKVPIPAVGLNTGGKFLFKPLGY